MSYTDQVLTLARRELLKAGAAMAVAPLLASVAVGARAYERVVNKDVRYRFVIDMASLKA